MIRNITLRTNENVFYANTAGDPTVEFHAQVTRSDLRADGFDANLIDGIAEVRIFILC